MTYHRGTLAEFNAWHAPIKITEGIVGDGRVGCINGVEHPENQRTTSYATTIPHPINTDDYIWYYGDYPDAEKTSLSQSDVEAAGWEFPTEA